jgi:hypothetical protein
MCRVSIEPCRNDLIHIGGMALRILATQNSVKLMVLHNLWVVELIFSGALLKLLMFVIP